MNRSEAPSGVESPSVGKETLDDGMIGPFLKKAFWLSRNSPGICRRTQVGEWLIYCLNKNSDNPRIRQIKREAVNTLLQFLELPQREDFEKDLIKFVRSFSQQAPMRFRECSSRIENGTDWSRTYQKSLIESSGRLCSFINYSRKSALDHTVRSSLVMLAWDMGCELRRFAELIGETDNTAKDFLRRAENLMSLRINDERLPAYYNYEHVSYALRRTPEGQELADKIEKWVFSPEWKFQQDMEKQTSGNAADLLKNFLENKNINRDDRNKIINNNDLFEIIATVSSITELSRMRFEIVSCSIDRAKPVVTLHRREDNISCRIQKNFSADDHVKDKLIPFRSVGNTPHGLQPDIVYKFWKEDSFSCVFLIGDAKNYSSNENDKINYPIALFDMMHYLIAFREELGLKSEEIIPLLECNGLDYQRIVLFFPDLPGQNEINPVPQPGTDENGAGKPHPILFVYGKEEPAGPKKESLQEFFEAAINALKRKTNF